jgi:hypothetical protein
MVIGFGWISSRNSDQPQIMLKHVDISYSGEHVETTLVVVVRELQIRNGTMPGTRLFDRTFPCGAAKASRKVDFNWTTVSDKKETAFSDVMGLSFNHSMHLDAFQYLERSSLVCWPFFPDFCSS